MNMQIMRVIISFFSVFLYILGTLIFITSLRLYLKNKQLVYLFIAIAFFAPLPGFLISLLTKAILLLSQDIGLRMVDLFSIINKLQLDFFDLVPSALILAGLLLKLYNIET